jgi:hypothetical protein
MIERVRSMAMFLLLKTKIWRSLGFYCAGMQGL